jgi:hypothetical protein
MNGNPPTFEDIMKRLGEAAEEQRPKQVGEQENTRGKDKKSPPKCSGQNAC